MTAIHSTGVTNGERDQVTVPYFRPSISDDEIAEVADCLRSGWLTTGPRTRTFESQFAEAVGARYAVALNSCTAALHLAVEALELTRGQAVLVPTMTFAATAEVVRYQGAIPILVDSDPQTLNMDLADAEAKLNDARAGRLLKGEHLNVVGIIPVHVGGLMMDMDQVRSFADRHGLWIVEDAAHSLPAAYRAAAAEPWRKCGEDTASVTCFSFYANKTMTTGEGGMAVTDDGRLAQRMRCMSLHGLSHDGWNRFEQAKWDYRIVAPGYKYNPTDIAAAIGIHQLRRVEAMRRERESISVAFRSELAGVDVLELPPAPANRIHSWHLFPIRLRLERLSIDRNAFVAALRQHGVGFSVHWRPLHLHPYYEDRFGWTKEQLPVATAQWKRLVSLPIFQGMREDERQHVIRVVQQLCARYCLEGHPAPPPRKPR